MAKVPFFVHMVTDPSEMTQFADIVLPSTFNAAEGWSVITNMGNLHATRRSSSRSVKRLWDVKQEETEVVWLLAEKLKAKGFPNLFDYYARSSRTRRPARRRPTSMEFTEIAAKISSAPIWMPKEPLKGDKISGWAEFRARHVQRPEVLASRSGWGGKFATPTKKFEFYSEALKKGLPSTRRSTRPRSTTSWRLPATSRAANRPSCRTTSRPSATAACRSTRSTSSTTRAA
jgi:anaerobic selenocysteine-containing dehydrogenase